MRVLVVIMDPRLGGISMRVALVSKELGIHGVDTLAVLPSGSEEGPELLRCAGVDTRTLAYGALIPTKLDLKPIEMLSWIPRYIMFPLDFARIVKEFGPDIVHVNGLYGVRAVIVAKAIGRKVVWHLVGTHFSRPVVWLWRLLFRHLADASVFVSNKTAKFYVGKGGGKPWESVIMEPVDTGYYSRDSCTAEDIAATRGAIGVGPDERILLFVGNLNKAKAVEVLLEAFHIVLKSQNNVKTIVSGKPIETQLGYWEFLQKRMSDLGLAGKAIFTGRYPNIRPLLAASTVFVMPSHAEGTPLAILEAMSMGIPVVATDVGGVAELVENGRTGILVPPGDPEAMATAICSLIGNPLLRESMGLESRKVAQTRFSKERCAERHLEVYRNTSNR